MEDSQRVMRNLRGRRRERFCQESWCISIQSINKFIEHLLCAMPRDIAVNKRTNSCLQVQWDTAERFCTGKQHNLITFLKDRSGCCVRNGS